MYNRTSAPAREALESSNRLLAALPPDALFSLRHRFEPVTLLAGEVLCEAGEALKRAYFVEAGVIALVAVFNSGAAGVMTTIGREGMVGFGPLIGSDMAFGRQLVHVHGSALAVEISQFRRALAESATLRAICEGYARAFLGEVLQTVACTGVHSMEKRCARWLLMSHDRGDGDTCALTEELLAQMLGVNPAAAAFMTQKLESAGLIRCRDGVIAVVDRPRLEAAACQCYRLDRDRYRRMVSGALN